LDAPGAADDGDVDLDETGDDQMIEVHRGLHAKLIWARGSKQDELWLGSANLTQRAWDGRNAEAVLHARVARNVGDGLAEGLVGHAVEVALSDLSIEPVAECAAEAALDVLRNRIAAGWDACLTRNPKTGEHICTLTEPPLSEPDAAVLTVRLLGQSGAVDWLPGAREVSLPATPLHLQTELVVLELRSSLVPELRAQWVARATLDPAPDLTRDRAVLARLMGPRAFLAWLRALLDETSSDVGDEPWPEDPEGRTLPKRSGWSDGGGVLYGAPTLESVLRAWVRNPAAVQQVDRAIETWGRELRRALAEDASADEHAALQEVEHFESTWAVVRQGLDLPQVTAS
jgi:hypothetical protein